MTENVSREGVGTGHRCPSPGCSAIVPSSMLACRGHWYSLPKSLRDAVWAGYRRDAGGADHMHAITDAVEYLRGESVT